MHPVVETELKMHMWISITMQYIEVAKILIIYYPHWKFIEQGYSLWIICFEEEYMKTL